MVPVFGDSMHAPASKLGRRSVPSLKKLFAVMAGFLGVSVVLAELASATTNSQPAIVSTPSTTAPVVAESAEPAVPTTEAVTHSTTVPASEPDSLTYGVNEVVKMYRGGIDTDVLLTYIETSNFPYQLSSKEILYLNQVGLPSALVNAMIRRDHQVQVAKLDNGQQTAQDASAPALSAPAPVSYAQPSVVVVQQPASHVHYVSSTPTCSTQVCAPAIPNVTVIGSRYGSTFYNGCYYGPFSHSPARAYFNAEFGPRGYSFYNFDYGTRFAYDGLHGGFGRGGFGHRFNRF
jgi:hypothetical protein